MKNKKMRNFLVRMLTVVLMIAFCCIATPFLNREFITVLADSTIADTNVSYFEGMAPTMSDAAIHSATRMSSKSSENPAMTFFVHGQSGDASHWSNNGNGEFTYDEDSLIEKLRDDYGGANVYWARMARDKDNNSFDDHFLVTDNISLKEYYPYEKNRFFLTKLKDGKYETNNFLPETQEFVTQLDDVSKHIIVVYESADPKAYHREEYKGLHTIVDRLSYDYRQLTGKLPKVDFISHSRGGITSMLYATGYRQGSKLAKVEYSQTPQEGYVSIGDGFYEKEQTYATNGSLLYDHPYNVNCLYSIGTPYTGTDMDNDLSHEILPSGFDNESAKNIVDTEIWSSIKVCWTTACNKNNKLKLYACAGEMNLYYLIGMVGEDREKIAKLLDKEGDLQGIVSLLDVDCRWISNNINLIKNALIALDAACVGVDVAAASLISIPGANLFAGMVFVASTTLLTLTVALQTQIPTLLEYINEYNNQTNTQEKLLVLDELLLHYHDLLQGIFDLITTCTLGNCDIMQSVGDGVYEKEQTYSRNDRNGSLYFY